MKHTVTIPIPPTPKHGKDRSASRPLRRHKHVQATERALVQMLDQAQARDAWRESHRIKENSTT